MGEHMYNWGELAKVGDQLSEAYYAFSLAQAAIHETQITHEWLISKWEES